MDAFIRACTILGFTVSDVQTAPGKLYIDPNLFVCNKHIDVVDDFILVAPYRELHGHLIVKFQGEFKKPIGTATKKHGISKLTRIKVYHVVNVITVYIINVGLYLAIT